LALTMTGPSSVIGTQRSKKERRDDRAFGGIVLPTLPAPAANHPVF